MTTIATQTVQQRFYAAVETAREHTHVALNVMTCCRSCATLTSLGLPEDSTSPYAWTFGGQGFEIVWRDGLPYRREEEQEEECTCSDDEYDEDEDGNEVLVYEGEECDLCTGYSSTPLRRETRAGSVHFQHGEGLEAARAVRDAFQAQGFEVVWDGTETETVQVKF